MEMIIAAIQLFIALVLLNVWLLRVGKPTSWRGGAAKNMREEFLTYGLPPWSFWVIGFFKATLAILLIVGLWVSPLTQPAAIGLAVLMLGAVAMHFKVADPFKKSIPAASLLVLCLIVAFL